MTPTTAQLQALLTEDLADNGHPNAAKTAAEVLADPMRAAALSATYSRMDTVETAGADDATERIVEALEEYRDGEGRATIAIADAITLAKQAGALP